MLKYAFVGLFEAKPTRTFCIFRLNRSLKKWVLAPPSILALALPSAIGRVISIQSHTVQGGFRGFYSKNTVTLTPKVIEDRGINQVYIIGGDGTQKGAAAIYELGKGLVYEVVGDSDVFPHFCGPSRSFSPLPLDAITKVKKLILSDGKFSCSLLN